MQAAAVLVMTPRMTMSRCGCVAVLHGCACVCVCVCVRVRVRVHLSGYGAEPLFLSMVLSRSFYLWC
jgi:hypothetical protein